MQSRGWRRVRTPAEIHQPLTLRTGTTSSRGDAPRPVLFCGTDQPAFVLWSFPISQRRIATFVNRAISLSDHYNGNKYSCSTHSVLGGVTGTLKMQISSSKCCCDSCFTEGETEARKHLVTDLGVAQRGSGRACSSPLCCLQMWLHLGGSTWLGQGDLDPRQEDGRGLWGSVTMQRGFPAHPHLSPPPPGLSWAPGSLPCSCWSCISGRAGILGSGSLQ